MSQNQAVRAQQDITAGVLFMAFELSSSVWLLAFGDHTRRKPRMISIQAGDLGRVSQEIEKAKRAFRLQSDAPVFSCYEAGRDGFWLHRALLSLEVENIVVDSASIEINRRKRRPKSDRLDAAKLLEQLQRFHLFNVDQKVWSVVVVPSEEIEDERQLHREIDQLTKMCTRHSNRIKSLLATQGLRIKSDKHFLERLAAARLWNGNPLGSDLRVRLEREYERLRRCDREKYGLQQEAVRRMKEGETAVAQTATKLQLLKGVGAWSGWKIAMELFGWRVFANRRQVAGAAGLAPSHYLSGLVVQIKASAKKETPASAP